MRIQETNQILKESNIERLDTSRKEAEERRTRRRRLTIGVGVGVATAAVAFGVGFWLRNRPRAVRLFEV
jgi:hypothetical protein